LYWFFSKTKMTFQWLLLKPKMGDYFYKPDGNLLKNLAFVATITAIAKSFWFLYNQKATDIILAQWFSNYVPRHNIVPRGNWKCAKKYFFQFFTLLDSQRINQASIIYRDHKSDYIHRLYDRTDFRVSYNLVLFSQKKIFFMVLCRGQNLVTFCAASQKSLRITVLAQ
jgi:hypothetical protein